MECLVEVYDWIQLTIFAKSSFLDVCVRSEYAFDYPGAFFLLLIEASTLDLPRIIAVWWIFRLTI